MRPARTVLLLAALLSGSPVVAAEAGGCEKFKWPIEADKARLASPKMVESGAVVDVANPMAVRVVMVEADKAGFEVPPGKPPAPGSPAGVLRFEAKAGLHQFTMTDRLWIDVVQNGKALEEAGFSGVLDCDGARKSVRFKLSGGPALLQFSGSPARTVAVSISRDPANKD